MVFIFIDFVEYEFLLNTYILIFFFWTGYRHYYLLTDFALRFVYHYRNERNVKKN